MDPASQEPRVVVVRRAEAPPIFDRESGDRRRECPLVFFFPHESGAALWGYETTRPGLKRDSVLRCVGA